MSITGPSGSGKSTIMHLVGALDMPSWGAVYLKERNIKKMSETSLAVLRGKTIGFIFQQFNLVDRLPVLVNVLVGRLHSMPWWRGLLKWFNFNERAIALDALQRVGILDCFSQRASTLSGGQQQRAAIARTLVQGAKLVLADEPIASLDPESSRKVMEILSTIQREDKRTVLVSLHQVDMAIRYCPRIIALNEGQVVYDGPSGNLTPSLLRDLYGMKADEFISGSELLPSNISHATPISLAWTSSMAQAS